MLDPVIKSQLFTAAADANTPSLRGRLVDHWANQTGYSHATIYRILKNSDVKPTRIPSGGRPRQTDVTTRQLEDIVSRIIIPAQRKTGDFIGSYRRYIEIAERAGIIDPGSLSEAQLKYYLDEPGMRIKELKRPRPTTRRRSDHINQMHQIDFSWCIMTNFSDKGRPMQFMDWQTAADPSKLVHMAVERSKKKVGTIWRIGLVDHYSGAFLVKYYQIPGENLVSTLDFLLWAWFPKDETGLIPHGIPNILLCDKGPGNTANILKNLCRAYGISHRTHATHHPEAKGSVEKFHDLVNDFELEFRFDPPYDIDELNRRAVDWMIHYQTERKHSRYGMPRFKFYQQEARSEYMRVPPDRKQFRDAAVSLPVSRNVAIDGTIKFHADRKSKYRLYMLPNEWKRLFGREKVSVFVNPFKAPAVVVEFKGERRLAFPLKVDRAGFREDALSVKHGKRAAPDAPELMRQRSEELGPVKVTVEPMTQSERRQVANSYPMPAATVQNPVQLIMEIKYDRLDAKEEIYRRLPNLSIGEKLALNDELTDDFYTNSQIDIIAKRYRKTATG